MIRTAALFALALSPLALLASAAPALAQADGEKVNQLIVYGDDPCPQSSENEITVCARKGESERYRIPEVLRGDPLSPKNEAWTDRVQAYETVGAQGIASCSTRAWVAAASASMVERRLARSVSISWPKRMSPPSRFSA